MKDARRRDMRKRRKNGRMGKRKKVRMRVKRIGRRRKRKRTDGANKGPENWPGSQWKQMPWRGGLSCSTL